MQTDSAIHRHEAMLLCQGMRFVRLQFSCDKDLATAMEFLSAMHPLKVKNQSRKSPVHYMLCDMLTTILRPSAMSGAALAHAHSPLNRDLSKVPSLSV